MQRLIRNSWSLIALGVLFVVPALVSQLDAEQTRYAISWRSGVSTCTGEPGSEC